MRFSHTDKKDHRVLKHSTYPLPFPDEIHKAPPSHGVFVLLNDAADVMYVGHNMAQDLRATVSETKHLPVTENVQHYRWFQTADMDSAKNLAADWIYKYSPANQNSGIK